MHVISVNVGRPAMVVKGDRRYSTAINRRPAGGPVELTAEGFVGDHVSDHRYHGGPDKAACVYPFDHYPYWRERLDSELAVPSFGENLTTLGLLENEVCIGDRFRIGRAVVQVTQPRQPCFKLAGKHDQPQLVKWINERLWTGFYLRTLEPGPIANDDPIELLERDPAGMTVAHAMQIMLDKRASADVLRELLDVPALSKAWRTDLTERLITADHGLFD
jgi:MOSC domain-containing protein YiiM